MIIDSLISKNLIHPPKWMPANTHFLTMMGSHAYGVASEGSDMDIYGFCIPPKDMVFPHLAGEIEGFGTQKKRFEQWTEAHIHDGPKEYDFSVYGIVKFFRLCMENNPNMTDALFVPRRCIIHSTKVAEHVRDNRRIFLHKGSFHKFRGYAFSQMAKIKTKKHEGNAERSADQEKFGYSTKYAYHLVRLALEAEQILVEHDLVLDNNTAILRSIRNGEWTLDDIENWFKVKEAALETLYSTSTLRSHPDEAAIKNLLLECLEMHWGTLNDAVKVERPADLILREMQSVIDRYKG
jgi:predicted nucleotidyltransferase